MFRHFIFNMIKISPTAKLPLELCRGTYAQRFCQAQKLTDNFFCKISKKFTTKDIEPDVFCKTVEEVLPSKINFKIENSADKEYEGAVVQYLNPEKPDELNRYKIYLPLNKYDNKISIYDTFIFMHEIFHFFCEISNPKHLTKSSKLAESQFRYYDNFFYNEFLYSDQCIDLKSLKDIFLPEMLDVMPFEEKILFLQNSRYRLKEEIHAWANGTKYSSEIQDTHINLISEKIEPDDGSDFKLGEKLKIVTDILKETLSDARKSRQEK